MPPRIILFGLSALIFCGLLYLGSVQGFWFPGIGAIELGLCFISLFVGQYLSSYLLEEYIMDYQGTSLGRWASAPIGIFFCILSFSIIQLSLDLLF